MIGVGLAACVVAGLLTTDRSSGSAAQLEWVQMRPLTVSKAVPVPGGGGQMRLTDAGIRATGTNISGYELYRVASVLEIDAGTPVGGARILCSTRAPSGSEVAQTPGSRASYPRSSEELIKQPVPEVVLVEFTSHGTGLAVVDFGDAFEIGENLESFTGERGIKLEWPTYEAGRERWEWFLPPGPPAKPLQLGFGSVWKTRAIPATHISCTLTTSAGAATVKAAGALPGQSEPIAE